MPLAGGALPTSEQEPQDVFEFREILGKIPIPESYPSTRRNTLCVSRESFIAMLAESKVQIQCVPNFRGRKVMSTQRQQPNGHFRLLAILLCFMSLRVSEAQATPTRHTWVRATPLGVNETSYFYLLMEHRNPGSHFNFTETFLLIRRDITNARLQERIKLRVTEFSADADDVWRKTESPTSGIKLGKYLRKHGVQLVFPVATPKDWKIEKNQLVRIEKGKTKVLVREDVMAQPLAELVPEFFEKSTGDHEFRISAAFESQSLKGLKPPSGMLVIIESGTAEYESDFCQHVVFVSDSALR